MFRLPSLIFCRSFFLLNMKTEYQKCLDGEPYDGAAPELAEMTLRAKRLISRLRSIDYDDAEAKRAVY